jgi:hypothetical protein
LSGAEISSIRTTQNRGSRGGTHTPEESRVGVAEEGEMRLDGFGSIHIGHGTRLSRTRRHGRHEDGGRGGCSCGHCGLIRSRSIIPEKMRQGLGFAQCVKSWTSGSGLGHDDGRGREILHILHDGRRLDLIVIVMMLLLLIWEVNGLAKLLIPRENTFGQGIQLLLE